MQYHYHRMVMVLRSSLAAALLSLLLAAACSGQLLVREPSSKCETNAGCRGTELCVDGLCIPTTGDCSSLNPQGACPLGRSCTGGVCTTDPTETWCACEPPQGCQGGDCVDITTSNACSYSNDEGVCIIGAVCVAGSCVPIDERNQCSETRPQGLCPDGATCVAGSCLPEADRPCSAEDLEGLCPAGKLCQPPGQCVVAPCSPAFPQGACVPNAACRDGVCELLPCAPSRPGGSCDDGSYCSLIGECILDGSCRAEGDCLAAEFCAVGQSCIPDGTCIEDLDCLAGEICAVANVCVSGDCFDERDCIAGSQFCDVSNNCRDNGTCGSDPDCSPGFVCNAGSSCELGGTLCDWNGTTDVGCPVGQLTCCPAGKNCCPSPLRCSVSGSCIELMQCIDDFDCPAQFSCVDNGCTPDTPCTTTCSGTDRCSFGGGCIPPTSCAVDQDCPDGESCNAQYECEIDCACNCTPVVAELVPPNMLIVLDRSGSMGWNIVRYDTNLPIRWDVAVAALDQVTTDHANKVRFGLLTFSGNGNTYPDTGEERIPVADNNAGPIMAALAGTSPTGGTPTGETLRGIRGEIAAIGLADPTRGNFIVLLTDGEANQDSGTPTGSSCGTNASGAHAACKVNEAIDALVALNPSVRVFVVGFAFPSGASWAGYMNCAAVHGTVPDCGIDGPTCSSYDLPGQAECETTGKCVWSGGVCMPYDTNNCGSTVGPCYYEANSPAQLSAAFDNIAGQIASCTYNLTPAPPDWSRVFVYLDYPNASDIPADCLGRNPCRLEESSTTWTRDVTGGNIDFHADSCSTILNGTASPVFIFGCCVGEGC